MGELVYVETSIFSFCRHLANANMLDHIRRVNTVLGLAVPALVSPVERIGETEMP